jgi:DNA-binding transcriptional LysR family regulator
MIEKDDLNWDDLRYFLRAAETMTLAGAARAMGVDHSTIGRRLSALERTLGAPLMIRAPGGLRLTPLGERLLPLVEQVERSVLAVSTHAVQQKTHVRMAMPTGFTKVFASGLTRFRADFPTLSLELMSDTLQVDLSKGAADLAIRVGPIHDDQLVARRLCDAGWALYASPTYLQRCGSPMDLDHLAGHELIGFAPGMVGTPASNWIEQRASHADIVLRIRGMVDMLSATLSGAGLALLPCLLGDEEPGLVRLTPHVLVTSEVSLVYRREVRGVEPIQAVIQFVLGVVRENEARLLGATQSAMAPSNCPPAAG